MWGQGMGVVDSKTVAEELRRRRLGRPALHTALACSPPGRRTWLPGDISSVPSPLLVLAAVSLAGHDPR